MKYTIAFLGSFFLLSLGGLCQPPDLFFKTMDGQVKHLYDYKGKKLLFIILPLNRQDTSVFLQEITTLGSAYSGKLVIVGIPAVEMRYKDANRSAVSALFSGLPANFVLTSGMNVSKTSGVSQASLFQWLTHKEGNRHFDQDVTASGYKFFIDELGRLYAVLGPGTRLSSPVIGKILSKPVPPDTRR